MADRNDSVLDKAENLARRILERLGAKVDSKLARANEQTLKPHVIGDLAARIEQAIESNLTNDEHGVRTVAPNRFRVLFTYEETSALSPQYIEAVGKELTATAFEYINNRRYLTLGPITLEADRDLFAKATTVKVSFDSVTDQRAGAERVARGVDGSKRLCFNSSDGRRYQIELKPESAPAYIGRAAGNAVRMDDPSVSRLHCSLSLRNNGVVVIADVGSANGTYVNEDLLGRDEARSLSAGDIVGVGDFRLTVSEIA
jgi:FHA domain/FhaA, N-terminal domain